METRGNKAIAEQVKYIELTLKEIKLANRAGDTFKIGWMLNDIREATANMQRLYEADRDAKYAAEDGAVTR
jgi:hypothetical protein